MCVVVGLVLNFTVGQLHVVHDFRIFNFKSLKRLFGCIYAGYCMVVNCPFNGNVSAVI